MITIKTQGPDNQTVEKTVEVGGGVTIRVPGTLYSTTCQVIEIDESGADDFPVKIKGVGFEGWVQLNQITDAMDKSQYALEHAMNVVGAN